MTKDIKDYLHIHLGCQICTGTGNVTLIAVQKETASTVFRVIVLNGNQIHEIEWNNDCRLALRPLSDIMDIHIEKIWDELGFNKKYESTAYPEMTKKSFLEKVFNGHQQISFKKFVILINFLRKNEYDCDNLIESGLAIDKTKLYGTEIL